MKTTLSAAFCLLTATLPLLISEATGQTQSRVDIAVPLRVCAAKPHKLELRSCDRFQANRLNLQFDSK